MEKISGVNNWKLVIRREATGVTILWAATCDARAALPGELFGLPVTALGHHALTPGRPMPEGEEVLVTCGPVNKEEWDNGALMDLTLPDSLERVGDYGFFNCRTLKTLRLRDTVRHWGGGALMNCRALDTFHIVCTGQEGELMAYLAEELPRELDMTLTRAGGQTARLIFPEYVEVYEENCPAHHFDYNIYGAGYGYHHCFYRKQLSFKAYDDLWRPMLGMEHDGDCALRLAWWRLRYPVELTEQAEKIYDHLCEKYNCEYDDRGNIGKRYRRQDEIGTPYCVTYDFDSENDGAVTIRDRDTMEQVRVKIEELDQYFDGKFDF